MIMMVTSSSLLGKALIWWRHSKHKWRAEMACGWNLKNRGERKSEALGGWWVLEQNLEWVCFSQGPKCCFEGGGVMKKCSRTIYLGIEEIWERHESKEGGEGWASFGGIKYLSGISSSLWKMFKLLKKKPEKVKQVIEFKLKFHATMVCMYVSIHVCMYARQFFFELLFFGGFFFGSDCSP